MKFECIDQEIFNVLKLNPEYKLSFEIPFTSPIVTKEHHIVNEKGDIEVHECSHKHGELLCNSKCSYCRSVSKLFEEKKPWKEVCAMKAQSIYHIPALVKENIYGIKPDLYIFVYDNYIHKAYSQLIKYYDSYGIDYQKELIFNYNVSQKGKSLDYSLCSFTNGCNTITLGTLHKDINPELDLRFALDML